MLKMFSFGTNTQIQTDKRRRVQGLSAANREARLARSKRLLKKYSDSDVDFRPVWFTDKKIFTVATPQNPQNDRLYVPTVSIKEIAQERLLCTRSTFSKSLTVCVKVGGNAADIRRSCSEDQWRIL